MTEAASGPGDDVAAADPLVGVTFNSAELVQFTLWRRMFHGIAAAGATPVAIDCRQPRTNIEDLVSVLDGLVLGGGGDIHPDLYGADPGDPLIGGVNRHRDDNELAALGAARASGLPILAICRGAQLVNVAYGGTLIPDLVRDTPTHEGHRHGELALARPVHTVQVEEATTLARWLERAGEVGVNSQHHQGLARLAPGFRVSALTPSGLIEAYESRDGDLVGIQWHPEVLWPAERHARALLRNFVDRCRHQIARPRVRPEGCASGSPTPDRDQV